MSKDYDRSIHCNPDADAWAKFFMETINDVAKEKGKVHLQTLINHDFMRGWFANAMMAMNDHLFQTEAFKKELKEAAARERYECVQIARRYVRGCMGERVTANAQRSKELAEQAIGASQVGDEIEKRGQP